MGRFEGFYTGGEATVDTGGFSGSEVFAQRRIKKEREQAKIKQHEQWEAEFKNCSSQSSLKSYINTHKNDVENPFVQQAKDKLDDLTFSGCRNVEDYKKYISNFPSGRHILQAKEAMKRYNQSSYQAASTTSSSANEIWEFVKKAIAIVAVLLGLVMLYIKITDKFPTSALCGYWVMIVGPLCKWAFDD